jgi:hypothetical protein
MILKLQLKKTRTDFFDLVKNYEVHVINLYALVFAFLLNTCNQILLFLIAFVRIVVLPYNPKRRLNGPF